MTFRGLPEREVPSKCLEGSKLGSSRDQVTPQVQDLIEALKGEMDRDSLQNALGLKARKNFRVLYLKPALDAEIIEMTIPDKPKSSKQKYRLTEKGRQILQELEDK